MVWANPSQIVRKNAQMSTAQLTPVLVTPTLAEWANERQADRGG